MKDSWAPDDALLREIEVQFDRAIAAYSANPALITEHANQEESIRTGGYASRTLIELVQNAADAMSGTAEADGVGRVEIVLDPASRILYCANSGRPFSKSGIVAITHAYLSGKRGDEIGRFGLGFKSVLAVSDSPQVLSRSVSFEFNSPVARTRIARMGSSSRRLPVLRTATPLDAQELISADPIVRDLAAWATTIVRLPNVENAKRLRVEMDSFTSEFLLFVSSVREIRLRVLGTDGFETSHVSRDLGNGRFKIERPDRSGDEWFVTERMHSPTAAARREVGEAVSRDEIKVSVAIPVRPRAANAGTGDPGTQRGQFWSYFPLQDRTSATAFFNAPWSVNDDRTTLLRNTYNREILKTMAEMFVKLVPRVATKEDPATILDYLPARGREAAFFGDEILCEWVPKLAAKTPLIPDGRGRPRVPADLRPLDLTCEWRVPEAAHEAWIASPNTAKNVPHWRCYGSKQRFARLRQLFTASADSNQFDADASDIRRALKLVPKRGILAWLREWSEGNDVNSAANALKVVIANRGEPDADSACVIPTTDGLRSISDRELVFLNKIEDLEVEGAAFVAPSFLACPGIEKLLKDAGFGDLGPIAVLNARLSRLTSAAGPELQEKFWEDARRAALPDAQTAIDAKPGAEILVPTRDGGWHSPQQVLDIDEDLPGAERALLLDRRRCVPPLAHHLGVVDAPRRSYSFEDEFAAGEYREWVRSELNRNLAPGRSPIESVSLSPSGRQSPGPFSVLVLLKKCSASDTLRESWTRQLLKFGDEPWNCEDTATGVSYHVKSPVRWAVDRAGLLRSTQGFDSPPDLVAPSLVQYADLLPLYMGPRAILDVLQLPNRIQLVPPHVLKRALAVESLPPGFPDQALVEFILQAAERAYPNSQPPRLPARVDRIIESRPRDTVYIATNDEQRDYLAGHQFPFLYANEPQASRLVEDLGCRRFEASFAFSVEIGGPQEPERLLDVFTGLRSWPSEVDLNYASLTRAASIAKLVTTREGVETQTLEVYRDGLSLTVRNGVDERSTLKLVSKSFEMGLTNADIDQILKVGLDHQHELLRQEARSAPTDADRLEAYFGDDDLRDKLPKGLLQSLEAQNLVSSHTRIAELYLSVYGKDTVKSLADLFRRDGFPDVPTQWAGRPATVSWLRKMGFGPEFAGQATVHQDPEFTVPGATILNPLHDYQREIGEKLRSVLIENDGGRRSKAMLVLPTGAGKTRVAAQTILQMFIDGFLRGPVLWIAQSQELCEQAIQTFGQVWRGLCSEQRVDSPLALARLWDTNDIHEPDIDFSVVVATDAKLEAILEKPDHSEYDWLAKPSAVFVDEGHVAGTSPRYTRIFAWLGVAGRAWERPLCGLSATPFKGTSLDATRALAARFGNRPLQAFSEGENVYSELVKIGVLARVRHRVLEGVDVELSDAEASDARRLNRMSGTVLDRVAKDHRRMTSLVDDILALDEKWGRSVLVFTPNVLSAQVLAATLRFHQVKSASVSGQTGRQERRDTIKRFREGEIRVLANCDLLTQGFDAPGVTALYIARPTFSPSAYIQMAGRGLRGPKNGGKEECLIVDMADNFGSSDINNLLGFREYAELWKEQQP